MSEADEEGGKMEVEDRPQKDVKQVDTSHKQRSQSWKAWGDLVTENWQKIKSWELKIF